MSLLSRVAPASRRGAVLIVLGWLLLVGVLASVAPSLKSVQNNTGSNGPAASAASVAAQKAVDEAFPGREMTPALVVVRSHAGTREATDSAVGDVLRAVAALRGTSDAAFATPVSTGCASTDGLVPGRDCIPASPEGLASDDGVTQVVVVPVEGSPVSDEFRTAVRDLTTDARDAAAAADVEVTGPAGIISDATAVFSSGDKVLLFGTILLVAVILLAIYRSPLLALVPLLAVGVAMRFAETIGALLADAGVISVSAQTASIMTVLLFGVGTDYALIITARYREALGDSPDDRYAAMRRAMAGVSESVLSSAATIVLAMFALLAAVSPTMREFGPYLALGVAAMAAVAFTFIPALTVLLGKAVFWPVPQAKASERARGGRIWRGAADLVVARPRTILAATLALLAVLSIGVSGYRESFDMLSGFRVATSSEAGREMVREGLGAGEIAPSTVLVSADGMDAGRAAAIASGIRDDAPDLVARTAFNPRTDLSQDGRSARVTVVLTSDPYGTDALDSVDRIREVASGAATSAGIGDAEVRVAGETATTADERGDLERDLTVLIPLILLLVGLVLGVLLRSVLAPLYLMATLLISFAATMGVTVAVTVWMQGDQGIGNRVTAYVFVFLVALGVDYNIFIMSRYRQELATTPPAEALRTAIARTGGVVSSAGLILAGTFSVLMTQPIRELYQFGFAMAVGILLDTFVVRPFLVPAIVRLLGERALWPQKATA